ncbi:hypothetical protein AS156_18345 [Bradyrhizobium macuxiense]|uniref:Enamine deaminase RidA (YjgF/YER057c/UK114 family) n=1 Tax=Bradyrhizobium macuxiense TaxID=1755647 RepID=A0A120FJ30_9BRAD|nr:RidA family protein [Bradyrhizobium macuxiense]KWV48439.1 hypothetical protein AS156_18345 [Bradyrhizobium macuxiense]
MKTVIQSLAVIAALGSLLLLSSGLRAEDVQFSKRALNVVPSHQGHFSDIVTVGGRSRTIFVWGVGAEDEDSTTQYAPQVRFRGEFSKQCNYALDKIGRMLATRSAGLADIVMLRVYLTDARNVADLYKCIDQRFVDLPRPTLTIANISQLAHSGMTIEIEATAAIANLDSDNTFSIFRNRETLGKWNVGATEVLEVAGSDSTTYFSGLHAIQGAPDHGKPVAMFPQDFVNQCGYVQKKMKAEMQALGGTNDNVVRSTAFVTGDVQQPDSAKCRAQLPKEDTVRVPGTLLNISQLGALGETYTYDIIAMMPAPGEGKAFVRKSRADDANPEVAATVTVSGARRTLYLSGIGSAADDGSVESLGNFEGQCRASMRRVDKELSTQDATLADVAKMLVFVTDSRYVDEYKRCMAEIFGSEMQPAQTFVNVARLPTPGMLFQVDVIAVTAQ